MLTWPIRERCFLYAQVLVGFTELEGGQIAAGEEEQAQAGWFHRSSGRRCRRRCSTWIWSKRDPFDVFCTLKLWPLLGLLLVCAGSVNAQDTDGPFSQVEVEQLRAAAPVPRDRMKVFESILNTRERSIAELVAKQDRPGYADDMHDALNQFGEILDEFNDNLDEYSKNPRDVRKELPQLLKETDRWATVLRSPPENDAYNIVKKMALDHLKDMRELVTEIQSELEAYFKAHPHLDAGKAEKERVTRND